MKKNIGKTDKLIRLIIAVVAFLLVYLNKITDETNMYITLTIALVAALTSLLNYCPIYSIFKINTNKK